MTEQTSNKLKILNDPIYGFITIPNGLICDLIDHPYFQRLRRISQMGLSYFVYPGAHHTRFHHAIGSMHLMQKAVGILKYKGIKINKKEANALYIAILLHDIGHGPFSHALENTIINNTSHETISLKFMEELNNEFEGKLTLAIKIFTGNYHRKFFYQLISSQLDMDRLDYLNRDSFYTGVTEGNISSERLIAMLNIVDDNLVIEEKGIYSVEKFIIARRLMYWQVYLHKTGLAAELVLTKILKRAKELIAENEKLPASSSFLYFLKKSNLTSNFSNSDLKQFALLDDSDVISAIKEWMNSTDLILSKLSKSLINRKLPKIVIQHEKIEEQQLKTIQNKVLNTFKINNEQLLYFVYQGKISNQAYDSSKNTIQILFKNGILKDISKASDQLNIQALTKPVYKYFLCYPK